MKRTQPLMSRTPKLASMLLALAISTQMAFGQGNSQGNGPVATPEDLYNYAILTQVAVMDQITQKAEAAHPNSKARDHAKQQTGLNDSQQAILIRYANQFHTANMAMFAARGAALQAKNQALAVQTERDFHTASKALI